VITDDEVMRLFERSDPARVDDVASVSDGAGYLDARRTRSSHVTIIEIPPTPTGPPRRHRWRIATAAAAAVVLIVGGALVLAARDNSREPEPDQRPVATEAPEKPANAAAEEVVAGFLEAYGAFDVDRAMAYLADDAEISPLLKSVGATGQAGGRDEFRLLVSWLEAEGYKQILDTRPQGRTVACDEQGSSASRATLRCEFAFHLLRSDEVGLGPFKGSYFDFTVRDGEIIRASTYWETAEFSPQLWEPFANWVSLAHPEDAAVMYVDETHSGARLTDESIPLWELHTGEYAGSGRSYIARADAICGAAHQRVREEGGPEFYNESWGRILDEALTELRAVPPPEAVRARFDEAYALVEQLADGMMNSDTNPNLVDVLHQIEGAPGMQECTFHGPR
jgi:hypothetical protein